MNPSWLQMAEVSLQGFSLLMSGFVKFCQAPENQRLLCLQFHTKLPQSQHPTRLRGSVLRPDRAQDSVGVKWRRTLFTSSVLSTHPRSCTSFGEALESVSATTMWAIMLQVREKGRGRGAEPLSRHRLVCSKQYNHLFKGKETATCVRWSRLNCCRLQATGPANSRFAPLTNLTQIAARKAHAAVNNWWGGECKQKQEDKQASTKQHDPGRPARSSEPRPAPLYHPRATKDNNTKLQHVAAHKGWHQYQAQQRATKPKKHVRCRHTAFCWGSVRQEMI